MVKALVLAAGYGTRLERDIKEDQSGNYKHLIGLVKSFFISHLLSSFIYHSKLLTSLVVYVVGLIAFQSH